MFSTGASIRCMTNWGCCFSRGGHVGRSNKVAGARGRPTRAPPPYADSMPVKHVSPSGATFQLPRATAGRRPFYGPVVVAPADDESDHRPAPALRLRRRPGCRARWRCRRRTAYRRGRAGVARSPAAGLTLDGWRAPGGAGRAAIRRPRARMGCGGGPAHAGMRLALRPVVRRLPSLASTSGGLPAASQFTTRAASVLLRERRDPYRTTNPAGTPARPRRTDVRGGAGAVANMLSRRTCVMVPA
jgi:hypothetical protein